MTFMQGSPDAAFLVDHQGKIIYRNKAAQLMFMTNVNQMSICSLFTFPPTTTTSFTYDGGISNSSSSSCNWDDISTSMTTSEPQHHNVAVLEDDGAQLDFRLNLVKLPAELMGDANRDVFACAYVTPAHDHHEHVARKKVGGIHSIAEEGGNGGGGGGAELEEDKQLLLLQTHMKDVVQASCEPMFSLYENGTIGIANDPAVQLLGYSHEELVGKDIASICPAARSVQNILHYTHISCINKNQLTTAIDKSGKELSIDLGLSLNQHFAGSAKHISFAHMKDLTALEHHKSEIEHKDTLCQAMINASFDPMFGIDQRGKIIVVNDAACQAFGYGRDEFLGNNISMICNDSDAINHDQYLNRYIRTGKKRVIGLKRPLVARRKDGSEFHIELGVSEVNLANGEKMFCGYVRDRTQERLDKKMLRRKDAVIQDKFFQKLEPEDARGAMKKGDVARCTQ
ncbi:hypothetical protein ACHAXR_007589 [Thalassiosira sp. AJA248-18]